ncbi:MAG TPA: hypothetical protein PLD59_01850 [Tepidisphaeraceae bacterium]|nr:hypothetical protein [Tepidisphaeraceae bacterium]
MRHTICLVLYSLISVVFGLMPGCTLPRAERSLIDTDPTAKIPAIKQSAKQSGGEAEARSVALLVDELDSDDAAVRFYAIRALRDITGETFDYRYFDDELERKPALAKWRAWLAEHAGRSLPEPIGE